jgi:hypothetical protein
LVLAQKVRRPNDGPQRSGEELWAEVRTALVVLG